MKGKKKEGGKREGENTKEGVSLSFWKREYDILSIQPFLCSSSKRNKRKVDKKTHLIFVVGPTVPRSFVARFLILRALWTTFLLLCLSSTLSSGVLFARLPFPEFQAGRFTGPGIVKLDTPIPLMVAAEDAATSNRFGPDVPLGPGRTAVCPLKTTSWTFSLGGLAPLRLNRSHLLISLFFFFFPLLLLSSSFSSPSPSASPSMSLFF